MKVTKPFQWFRMYHEFSTDPKVQTLAFEDQRHYVMALCMKASGILDSEYSSPHRRKSVIAKVIGLDLMALDEACRRLCEAGLINDQWQPIKWDARQTPSDHSAAERMREYRKRQRDRLRA